jgi:hypothetical protein
MLARQDPVRPVVSRFVDAWNREDAEALAACLAFNCVIASYEGVSEHVGARAVVASLAARFGQRPKLQISVANRMTMGDVVAQMEAISAGSKVLDRRIALYRLTLGQIARIDVIRN